MKKTLLIAIAALGLLASAAFAGTGPSNVGITPHNLGAWQPDGTLYNNYSAKNDTRVCVFCHTPHGGSLDQPLWNRDSSTLAGIGKFTHFTSANLTAAGVSSTRAVNPESLACLTCHDGSIGVGDIINAGSVTPDNAGTMVQPGFGTPGPRIGGSRTNVAGTGDLSDDHPISVSYKDVLTALPGSLHTVSYVENTKGLVLYGTNEYVECSSCHDPHVDYINNPEYDPFLAIPNTGSDLCLSCHIK